MLRLRRFRSDLLALLTILLLALLWFAPVLAPGLTHATLLPFDNLYTFEPWRSLQPDLIPHNELLSDLVLENAVWKAHIREALAAGELPLWNPKILTGIPFLAAGQASTFYPLNVLFYLLPLDVAYGWFTALQVAIAGATMYLFGRVLRLRVLAALFGAVVYMFSGFLIVSVVFTMFLAATPWLPLLLAVIEVIVRKQEAKGVRSFRPIPYVAVGAGVIGLVVLAGHPELIYYTLLTAGAYSLVRLIAAHTRIRRTTTTRRAPLMRTLKLAGWLLTMAVLGVALGAVQLLPLVELLPLNFREGSASLAQVLDWAWPSRHVLTFALPNIFGSPSHHQWFDLWTRTWTPVTVNALGEPTHTIFWGVKNYVEGGNYLGLATWLLAAVAVVEAVSIVWKKRLENRDWRIRDWEIERLGEAQAATNPQSPISNLSISLLPTFFFAGLAAVSLLFAFGTPLYAILYYGLPGWSQLHSPFRWVFPFTLSMAALGALGLNVVLGWLEERGARGEGRRSDANLPSPISPHSIAQLLVAFWAFAGLVALLLVLASLFAPAPFVAFGQRIVDGSDLAQRAFADGRMFWSYQAANLAHFGGVALFVGLTVWWMLRGAGRGAQGGASTQGRKDAEARRENQLRVDPSNPRVSRSTKGQKEKGEGWEGETPVSNLQSPISQSPNRLIALSLIAITVLDLFLAHGQFNPASDPALSPWTEEGAPPVVKFLNAREGLDTPHASSLAPAWRFTTFNAPGEKTFNANVGMYYGWHDVRGYDSIIPRQYAGFMQQLQPQENELLYNRIAPIYAQPGGDVYAALDNPLLDLLNVKYVITGHAIPNPGWQEIYQDDAVRVYENQEVLPRVFIAPTVRVVPVTEQPLTTADLRQVIFIEATPAEPNALIPASPQLREANISRYTANEIFIDVNLSDRGWLFLGDAYFPGWKAYLRPFGGDESQETELTIYRANGAFRTVYLPTDGQWTVRFVYSPMSFKLGLYISFLAAMTLLMLLLYWVWGRYYRPEIEEHDVKRVAKNSLIPMGLSLFNKAVDFAFAMLYVRLLGPAGTGEWYFVVAIYGFFEIISRYGLGTLLTRDVAADKHQSSRYLTNVLALRTLLWAVSLPLLALVVAGYWTVGAIWPEWQAINAQEGQALILLALAMLFANYADALSSMFMAFEKMEYPAGLTNAVALLKVALGAAALLLGYGYIGLAAVALLVNVLQVIWLYTLLRATLFKPQWQWDWSLQRWMFAVSGPLMINHLLATIFWRIDIWILRPLAGAAAVGLYSIGLKYLDGLNIIPSMFTMAIFPLMSRFARTERSSLLRAYVISLRLLTILSLPIAMSVTFLATPLVFIVGGAQYLNAPGEFHIFGQTIPYVGGADLAFQVIIWSIPIGFINSVTQYVLIAVNQQRTLTRAFVLGVVFNVVGNLILIPSFGYVGAATATILSEFSLLIPFYIMVRRHVGVAPWGRVVASPLLSVAAMGVITFGLIRFGVNDWLAVAIGLGVYGLGLLATGAFRGEDMAAILNALPIGPLRRLLPAG
ncbi:MAG TPA: oligosaccharide flippase family protein [Chloroflexi bacterium]|nr:oligosaccharide flippase family protein [Chloroflexota bacterium]